MGSDGIQGHVGEHRFVYERAAAGYRGISGREEHGVFGSGVDSVRFSRSCSLSLSLFMWVGVVVVVANGYQV